MNNLTTRKIVLGMLLALVLAFSVQGIADALTFSTSKTGDLETKAPNETFTIRFTATLKGNTAIRSGGNLVKDSTSTGGAANARIDSSGYLVVEIDGKEYRTIETQLAGNLVVDPRPTYNDETPGTAGSPNGTYYVDSSKNVVDEDGDAVYVQTGDGTKANNDDPNNRIAAVPWRYTRAKADPTDKVPDLNRYHYNEETIKVDLTGNARIIRVGSRNVNLTATDDLDMYERTHPMYDSAAEHEKLSGSVSLVIEPTGTDGGVVTVKVTDESLTSDAPINGKSDPITFTLYSVKYQNDVDDSITTLVGDGVEYAFDNDVRPLSSYFTFPGTAVPAHYSIEGSGTFFIRQTYTDGSPTSVKTASKVLSTSDAAPVHIDMKKGTNKVTAWVSGGTPRTMIFIYSGSTPANYPEIEITGGSPQTGAPSGRLDDYFEVKVTDGRRRPISGLPVTFTKSDPDNPTTASMFIPVSSTRIYAAAPTSEAIDAEVPDITIAEATSTFPATSNSVQTDQNGVAKIYYQLSSNPGAHTVTAAAYGIDIDTTLTATASTSSRARIANLEIVSGNNQRADKGKFLTDDLVVIVRSLAGHRVQNVIVQFRTTTGTLVPSETTDQPESVLGQEIESPLHPRSGQQIYVETGPNGEAGVTYNVGQLVEARDVIAEIREEAQATTQYDFAIDRMVFNVNGGGTPSRPPADEDDDEDEDDTPPPASIVVPPTVTGTAGGTATLRVTAPATATVTAGGRGDNFLLTNIGSFTRSGTTHTSTLTLPNQVTSYSLTVFVRTAAGTTTSHSVTVSTTAAPAQTGTLTVRIDPFSGAPGSTATVTVTAADSSAQSANVTVNLTATGGTLSSSSVLTGTTGTTTVTLTRGSTVGTENHVTVSGPSGYDSVSGRFVIAGPAPRDMTVGAAAELNVYDGNNQMGSLNSRLAEPFIVEVVDANDNPVEDARVRFRTTIGSGRFSPRTPRTDEDGFAETTFTPTSTGRIRVVATVTGADSTAAFIVQGGEPADALVKISGDDQSGTPGNALANPFVVEVQDEDGEPLTGHSVTFSVTAGGGSLSETSVTADEDGLAETTLTLGSERGVNSVQASVSGVDPVVFNTNIEPKILVAVANRPVMYWIDSGMLYGLAGAKAAKIAESANDVAVGGGKVYWTEQTGESSGTINSANLDGTVVRELVSIRSVPMGIAVDTAGSKVYWTASSGKIKRANLNGSGSETVLRDLSDPTDIVVSNGFIYWTEGGNSIRRVSMSGQKIVIDVAVNLDTVGGLAVGGGKVYWTEQTSASAGTVNGANLNGTNFKTLASTLSAPMGVAVDTAGSKLYWTSSSGKVKRANLDGSRGEKVVEGLISPSKIAIGGANTETETITRQPAAKDNAKYDVNGDGKVDNVDANLVVTGLGTGNAKYDVDGDGTVNFLDLLLVFDNRDDDAAAAPTIVGMKLTAIQIDIIQEQIDLLIATNDRSPAALRTLIYMQQLLVTARPEKTQLFANYPNPFNPETWIPYELATDTHVRITIYNTQGVVIRTLQFGHQSAGYYTGRDRAAYWDGRNALGEQVASGLYFYQLETDEMSLMRKMVILK